MECGTFDISIGMKSRKAYHRFKSGNLIGNANIFEPTSLLDLSYLKIKAEEEEETFSCW